LDRDHRMSPWASNTVLTPFGRSPPAHLHPCSPVRNRAPPMACTRQRVIPVPTSNPRSTGPSTCSRVSPARPTRSACDHGRFHREQFCALPGTTHWPGVMPRGSPRSTRPQGVQFPTGLVGRAGRVGPREKSDAQDDQQPEGQANEWPDGRHVLGFALLRGWRTHPCAATSAEANLDPAPPSLTLRTGCRSQPPQDFHDYGCQCIVERAHCPLHKLLHQPERNEGRDGRNTRTADTHPVRRAPGEPRRLTSLEGETIAVMNNGWACMAELSVALEEVLIERGAADVVHVRTPHSMPMPKEHIGEIAAKVAGAVTGLGN
jgi:hypothetical protein